MTRPRTAAALAATAALAAGLLSAPAQAAPDGSQVVISEAYVNGSAAGAAYTHRFVELHNPTDEPLSLAGLSLQYRSATGTAAATTVVPLSGTVAPDGYFLVRGSANSDTAGAALPEPDQSATFASSGSAGTVVLARGTSALRLPVGDVAGHPDVVDLVGYGTSNTFEKAPAAGQGAALSLQRDGGADADDNAGDLAAAAPTPCTSAGCAGTDPDPEPEPEPQAVSIAEVQGPGAASPLAGRTVTTTGVVTAAYPDGGLDGAYLQTGGTGGDAAPEASHGVFAFGSALARGVRVGDTVTVTGEVVEYNGLTEIEVASFAPAPAQPAVKPSPITFPMGETDRERYEGMLVEPTGAYTVTDNYATNQYGEVGLAPGTEPLRQPTDEARPGTDAYRALVAANAAALVTLDDGASANYLAAANQGTPVPWLTGENEVRVGSTTTFTDPVVLDFRFGWKLQPTARLVGDDEAVRPVAPFSSTREDAPRDVGGRLRLATFNVLNYFTTVGEEYAAASGARCTYHRDRDGDPVTVDDCGPDGPRGAATTESLRRQEAKIVRAINGLDADVVSLEEIENSRHYGPDRDAALATLVDALNAEAGAGTWAFVPSPAVVPASEDVIRTAFVYRPAAVELVGESVVLDDERFANARQPLSQGFRPRGPGDDDVFAVIVNHFKSKGSGSGPDADTGDGQGASNHSRVRQSQALVELATAEQQRLGTERVFLTGDFNAYAEEDPIVVLEEAGYTDLGDELTDEDTYQFDGLVGSLDHVLASPAARDWVTGADVWNVNAYESIAREYSRHEYNVTDLYDTSAFRSSDHDPIVVGIDPGEPAPAPVTTRTRALVTPLGALVTVTARGGRPTGTVTLLRDGRALGTARLVHGVAYFSPRLYGFRAKGVSVRYEGDGTHAPSVSR